MFDENSFNNDLKSKLDSIKILDQSSFEDIFINVLNNHGPINTKIIPASNHELMTKALRKGIRTRSRLRNSHFEKTKILPIGITAITTKFLY